MNRPVVLLLCLVILGLIAVTSCKSSEKKKLPDKATAATIVDFATLPSYKTMFPLLDKLPSGLAGKSLVTKLSPATQEPVKKAFRTGAMTANMLIASMVKNTAVTRLSSTEVVNSTIFRLSKEEKQKYLNQLSVYYQTQDWEKLGKSLDQLKKKTETDLWESKDFETYTLTILGGWVEATRQIFSLLSEQSDGQTLEITTENAWTLLRSNMNLFRTQTLVESPAIKETKARVDQLASLETNAKGKYSKDQIDQALKLCEAIKSLY